MGRSYKNKLKWIAICCAVLFMVSGVSAYASDTIKVGVLGPMKFMPGVHTWAGCKIAADEINKSGGVKVKGEAYKLELIKKDTNEIRSMADAVNAMQTLINSDKVAFLIGGFNSEPVLAMQEVMADHKKIWFSPCCCDTKVCARIGDDYDRYKYFFRTGGPNTFFWGRMVTQQLMMVIEKIRAELGIQKPRVAIFIEKSIFAEHVIDEMMKHEVKDECEFVGKWIVSRLASDVRSEMGAVKAAKVHIILNVDTGPVGVAISKAWGELKIPAALIGVNVQGGVLGHWKATSGMCDYSMTNEAIGRVEITEKTIPFCDKFYNAIGQRAIFISADSYDSVYILKEAIERAGTIETEAVLLEIGKTEYKGATGTIKYFPEGAKWPHDLQWGPPNITWVALQWRDKKLVTVWPDGKGYLGDKGFNGLRYKGTQDYVLPPLMVKHWKGAK